MHPTGFRPFRLGRASPPFVVIALVALLLGGLPPAALLLHPAAHSPSAPPPLSAATPTISSPPKVHPSTSIKVSGSFYGTNSTFANLPASADACGVVYQNYSNWAFNQTYNNTYSNCWGGAQNPSLLNLANGNLGVSYSTFTDNQTGCVRYSGEVVSRVGFQVSTDSGATFGPAQYLGNETCTYLQAIEPSFAVSSSGTVYGTFVEENETSRNNTLGASFPMGYANRTADGLGFTVSTDNGTTFSPVTTVSQAGAADIARPQLATFGQTVYVVYDQFNNWTNLSVNGSYYGLPSFYPMAVDLIYSSDGGVTWHGPYTLPGLNATWGYNSYSPAISVSSTGELAVAYATYRSCFEGFGAYCYVWGDHAVVATSTSNGTSWSVPSVLGFVGDTHRMGYNNDTAPTYWYYGYAYEYQTSPEVAVAWSDTSPSTLYTAWAGEYSYLSSYGFPVYGYSGVFTAASTNGGTSWTNGSAAAPTYTSYGVQEYNFDPALTVHAGTAYLAYSNENESYCYPPMPCGPFTGYFSYWMVNSTNGYNWSAPSYLAGDPAFWTLTQDAWAGYNDALTYTSDGPVASFSQPQFAVSSFGSATHTYPNGSVSYETWNNNTGQSDLTVALPWTGATVSVNVSEDGLPAGTSWNLDFSGDNLTVNVSTIVFTNVPVGQEMFYQVGGIANVAFWTRYAPVFGSSGVVTFTSAGNLTIAFELEYGLALYLNPDALPYLDFYSYLGSGYFSWYHCGPGCNYFSQPFPWFVPVGTSVTFDSYDLYSAPLSAPIAFTGFGNGSSTVVASTTSIVMNGPINETLWYGVSGAYPVTFVPYGLPATSTYSFTFGGTVYSGNGTADVTVTNVSTGAYGISNIVANSSIAGWEYFGQASTGPTVVVPNEIKVYLNFSGVDVGAPVGPVALRAVGLAVGDFWTISFNGSQYGSTTPWINLTEHPGTYSVAAYPVPASANDSSAYTPVGFGPSLSVNTSSTYLVNFTTAYRVEVIAGAGGSVTGAGSHWLTPGSVATYTASPNADYNFLGWTGTGTGSYSGTSLSANVTVGGPISESANFQALPVNRFNLTFLVTGLPSGTWWTVDVNGTGYSSDQPVLVVPNLLPCSAGTAGQYPLAVPDSYLNGTGGTRYLPGGYPSSVCTTGTTSVTIAFATEYLVTPLTTGGGVAYAVVSGTPSSNPIWVAAGATIGLEELTNLNELFTGWVGTGSGSYTGANPTATLVPGGPVTETATFAAVVQPPPVTYELGVHSTTPLATGTSWTVTVDGTSYSATGAWVNVSGLTAGAHTVAFHVTLAPDQRTQYTPTTAQTTVTLSGNQSITVAFQTAYWVSESASPGGSLVGAFNGFETAGRGLTLGATPASGYSFVGWVGTGTGAYTGSNASETIVVNSPVAEVATFAPLAPSGASGSALSLGSPTVLVALALVGLVVGLGVGYVVTRRGARGPGGSR